MKISERPTGYYEAERLLGCLGDTQPFCSSDLPLLELPQLRERTCQPCARKDGGKAGQTEALVEEMVLDVLNSPGEVLDSLRVCADGCVHFAKKVVRRHLERGIVDCPPNAQRLQTALDRAGVISHRSQSGSHIGGDPAQPALVVLGFSQCASFVEMIERSLELSERYQRAAQVEPQVHPLRDEPSVVWKVAAGIQGLLDGVRRFRVGGPAHRLGPGLLEVAERLLPELTAQRVEGKRLEMPVETPRIEALDRGD